jgi:hypothetical protein
MNLAGRRLAVVGTWPDGNQWVPVTTLDPLSVPPVR